MGTVTHHGPSPSVREERVILSFHLVLELDVVSVREFRWMALCPEEKHFYRLGRI